MKKIILCAALALPFAAVAQDICATYAELSRVIMGMRQNGAPMDMLLQEWKGDTPGSRYARAMVFAAYDQPRWQTPRNKQRAIEDFGNDNAAICYRAQKGGV